MVDLKAGKLDTLRVEQSVRLWVDCWGNQRAAKSVDQLERMKVLCSAHDGAASLAASSVDGLAVLPAFLTVVEKAVQMADVLAVL